MSILNSYPNKANSWLNGKTVSNWTVVQVYRNNNSRFPSYKALVRDQRGEHRLCDYNQIGKAFNRNSSYEIARLFAAGTIVGNSAAPAVATASRPGNATNTVAAQVVAAAGSTNDEDIALAMMTSLVKGARNNPRVANIVKTMAGLI